MGSPVVSTESAAKKQEASVRPRRTTRAVVSLSVQINVVGPAGPIETITGRSVVVNKFGGKIESKKPLVPNQVAEVTVVATGKKGRGKVVWADSRVNKDGNYEFAIQFEDPYNPWGVEFPPEDWGVERQSQKVTSENAPGREHSAVASDEAAPPVQPAQTVSGAAVASAVSEPVKSDAPADPPEVTGTKAAPPEPVYNEEAESIDLTSMISSMTAGANAEISTEFGPVASPPQPADSEISAAPEVLKITPATIVPPLSSLVVTQPSEAANALSPTEHSDVSTAPTADPVSPLPGEKDAEPISATPASRLADAIRDLIQSTLSAQQSVVAERLIDTIKERMAQTQHDVLDRLSEQVQSVVSAQTSVLKQRADEIASQSQQSLSAQLQQMAGAAGESAKASQDRAVAAVESAMEVLQSRVAEQLPQTQKIFLDQCRSLAEQSLSGIVENSLRTLSLRIEEANKGIDRLEERTQKILLDASTQMEQNAATRIDQTTKHMETQLKEMAQRVYVNLQQYSVAELAGRQQAVEAAFRKQMQEVSEASLQEAQGALARMLHGLAEKMRPTTSPVVSSSTTP